ncbi:MAG: nucleotidyltransferase domain-containing protein [Anaerolineales bacterium]|nr:nucleotidyltransferase domain-containing protein [Anaerolineales bacterium]
MEYLRAKNPEIERLIWFGSRVNGLLTPGSDVDLCIVITSSTKSRRDRIPDYGPVGFPVGIDLSIYTSEEFKELRESSPAWYNVIIAGREMVAIGHVYIQRACRRTRQAL